jgi:2-haloacid dehalogenase
MPHTIPDQTPALLIFDVNETLLNLSGMKGRMNQIFDYECAFGQWFAQMLQYALVGNVTGQYHDFGTIGKAAFQMTEEKLSKKVSADVREEVLKMIRSLPPHPDVSPGLQRLREAGYRLVALTNSTEEVVQQQVEAAGLSGYFEGLFSVDSVKKYKPAPEPYRHVTTRVGVRPEEAMLVAAHGWDVAGALQAGLQAAFVARPGQALYPLAPRPQLIATDLMGLADELTR